MVSVTLVACWVFGVKVPSDTMVFSLDSCLYFDFSFSNARRSPCASLPATKHFENLSHVKFPVQTSTYAFTCTFTYFRSICAYNQGSHNVYYG